MSQHELANQVAGTEGVLLVPENDAARGRNGSKRNHNM